MSEKTSSTKSKAPSKKEEVKKQEPPEISAEELIKAASVLSKAYATLDQGDPSAKDGDIHLFVTVAMRMGKGEPLVVEESRNLRSTLVSPGISSAPEEVDLALRQILLPILKEVQQEATRRLEAEGSLDAEQNLGFKSSIPLE